MADGYADVEEFELVEHPDEEFKVPTPYASDDDEPDEPIADESTEVAADTAVEEPDEIVFKSTAQA